MNYFITDVKKILLPMKDQQLVIAEGVTLPLCVQRFFIITAKKNEQRGQHAHRQLTQYLICLHGSCEVTCDDGKEKKTFLLDRASQGLYIPPGIWAEQWYHQENTILLVACDALYDEKDYIREYDLFLKYRMEKK